MSTTEINLLEEIKSTSSRYLDQLLSYDFNKLKNELIDMKKIQSHINQLYSLEWLSFNTLKMFSPSLMLIIMELYMMLYNQFIMIRLWLFVSMFTTIDLINDELTNSSEEKEKKTHNVMIWSGVFFMVFWINSLSIFDQMILFNCVNRMITHTYKTSEKQ